jgi:hypothetical protein
LPAVKRVLLTSLERRELDSGVVDLSAESWVDVLLGGGLFDKLRISLAAPACVAETPWLAYAGVSISTTATARDENDRKRDQSRLLKFQKVTGRAPEVYVLPAITQLAKLSLDFRSNALLGELETIIVDSIQRGHRLNSARGGSGEWFQPDEELWAACDKARELSPSPTTAIRDIGTEDKIKAHVDDMVEFFEELCTVTG